MLSNASSPLPYVGDAARWIETTADIVAAQLQDYGLSGDDLSLIGHSLGGYLSHEVAERIHSQTKEKVTRIITLDIAAQQGFNFTDHLDWRYVLAQNFPKYDSKNIYLKAHAEWSWAFHTSPLGSTNVSSTAHESFYVNFLRGSTDTRHLVVKFNLF